MCNETLFTVERFPPQTEITPQTVKFSRSELYSSCNWAPGETENNIDHDQTAPEELFRSSLIQGPVVLTSLVNVSLKFQMLISGIYRYFLLEKCEKLLQCKSFFHFFNKKYWCIWA